MSEAALKSTNCWDVLGAVLVRAQRGNFSELHRIERLLRSYSAGTFWHASIALFSYASSWEDIARLGTNLRDLQSDPATQNYLAILYGYACDLRAVEPLLDLHRQSDTEDVRYEIERTLSYLLEPENGPIWWGADEDQVELDTPDDGGRRYEDVIDKEGYAVMVRNTCVDLRTALKTTKIIGAIPFAVAPLADRLNKRLLADELQIDRISHERTVLEAATGVNCSGFSNKQGEFFQLGAAEVMSEILDGDLSRYEPGRRYFFGHLMPD